jgi:hypothetical protein
MAKYESLSQDIREPMPNDLRQNGNESIERSNRRSKDTKLDSKYRWICIAGRETIVTRSSYNSFTENSYEKNTATDRLVLGPLC